jgi:hypothetical protein
MKTHFGDPCLHCGIPHDEVEPGPCRGDHQKAIVLAYCIDRQGYENWASGCETVLCLMSSGEVRTEGHHPAMWWWNSPYFKNAEVLARNEFYAKHMRKPAQSSAV